MFRAMIDREDLLIELRNGEQCVEARFLRGTRQRFETLSMGTEGGWLPFAQSNADHARLIDSGRTFRSAPGIANLIEHGTAIWQCFDPRHRNALLEFRANHKDPISRVSIRVAESVAHPFDPVATQRRTARDLWQQTAFECLVDPASLAPDRVVQTFFLGGDRNTDWALRRVLDLASPSESRRLPSAPIRVLLLLTSLHDEHDETRRRLLSAACDTILELRKVLASDTEVELTVAGSRCDLEERGGRWFLPGLEVAVDRHYGTEEDLEKLLATRSDEAPHAIVFLGHSDAEPGDASQKKVDALARHLRFRLHQGGNDRDVDIPLGTLAKWLSVQRLPTTPSTLEFIAALNCSSAALAEQLLELAPDVIATNAMVPGQAMAAFAGTLLAALRDDELLATAFVRARQGIPNAEHRPLVVQLSRTLDDVSFLGPNRRALARYHEKVHRKHDMLEPEGANRKARFERVHVELALTRIREEENWRATREAFEHGKLTETVDFEAILGDPRACWILRGVAGAGKTTTLRRCALLPPVDRVPIYLSLPSWLGAKDHRPKDPDDASSILRAIADAVEVSTLDTTIRTIAARGLGRQHALRPVFLLDAFDELDEEQRDIAQRTARTLADTFPDCPVVISSRERAEIGDLGPRWQTARLLPLDSSRQRDLVAAWVRADAEKARPALSEDELLAAARKVLDAIHGGGPRMAEFTGNPLLLTLLVNLQLDAKTLDGHARFDLGLHRVMSTILDRLLAGQWRRREQKKDPKIRDKDALRQLLRALSWSMLHRSEGSPRHVVDRAELLAWMRDQRGHPALAAAAEFLKGKDRMDCALHDIPDPLADESPFCPEDPVRKRHWTFTHNLLQEALCAEHWWHVVLKERNDDAAVDDAIRHLRERIAARPKDALDFWTEPVAFLAGWMGNDRIVVELLKSKDTLDLGLRAMAAVDHLQPETVREVLELLPPWGYDAERAREDKKGPRVEAYEIIAAQTRPEDVEAMAKVLMRRAGVK